MGAVLEPSQLRLPFSENAGPGRLISIDGLDGAGKTTLVQELAGYLSGVGVPVVCTRMPTDRMRSSSTFNQVQRLGNLEKVDPIVFELEYMVDRIQHCKTFIEPALRAGSWVIVDRYALSSIGTLLLQLPSLGRAAISAIASELWFRDLCRYLVRPDVALLLQVDPQTAIARLNNRKEELDRNINASDYAELQRFLVAVAEVNGMILVEASGPLPAVVKTCREFVVKPNAREGRQV